MTTVVMHELVQPGPQGLRVAAAQSRMVNIACFV
jgi:hypothetical protein